MAGRRLPLLRGRITSVDTYEAPQGGGGKPPAMPSLDPKAHSTALLQQLDAITQQVNARTQLARDELAKREIVAVRPAANEQLAANQLDDSKADARLVGVMTETGTVLLDVASADLGYLREKVQDFGDDSKVVAKKKKDGLTQARRPRRPGDGACFREGHRASRKHRPRAARRPRWGAASSRRASCRSRLLVRDRLSWWVPQPRAGYRQQPGADRAATSPPRLEPEARRVPGARASLLLRAAHAHAARRAAQGD